MRKSKTKILSAVFILVIALGVMGYTVTVEANLDDVAGSKASPVNNTPIVQSLCGNPVESNPDNVPIIVIGSEG